MESIEKPLFSPTKGQHTVKSVAVLEPLWSPLSALPKLIEAFDNRGIIIGGVAASILGKPRLTADADAIILLSVDDIPQLIERAEKEGLVPRLHDAADFARRNRIFLLRHEKSGVAVDISLGLLPFEIEAVERSQECEVGQLNLRLPTPEDLIILKAVAHRPKDMLDIEAIVAMQDNLYTERIYFWVKQFADLLELPELFTEIEKTIQRKRPQA